MSSGFQLARRQAEAYESFTRAFMEGSARLLAHGASIRPGDVVLDLACGTGLVARHAVPLVAPDGRVVGADINVAMLEVARAGLGDAVELVEASCDALPFEDESFTHVICQQGMQFFPEPLAAMSEAMRVLGPGGVIVATIWATLGHNPYIDGQLELLAALEPSLLQSVQRATPPNADELLRALASSSGFDDIDITLLEHWVDIADFGPWFLAQTAGTPWAPALDRLTDAARDDLVSAMETKIEQYVAPDGGHCVPFRSYRLEAHR